MYRSISELYERLIPYTCEIIQNNQTALRLSDVFIRADIPLQHFITSVKLYKRIINSRPSITCCNNPTPFKGKIGLEPDDFRHNLIEIEKYYNDLYSIMVSCLVICSKYYRDTPFTNFSWQDVTGIGILKLNRFEMLSAEILKYEINTIGDHEIYLRVQKELNDYEKSINKKQIKSGRKSIGYFRKLFCFS